jgi:tetratricopeptide (TPR) repeat protein
MKRALAALVLLAIVSGSIVLVQRQDRDRRFRQLLTHGEEAGRTGNYYAAIEDFSGAIALRPDSMVPYYRRGEAYRAQRRDAEALRDLRTASRLAPDSTQPLVALGQLYESQGDAAQAADWYGQAAARLQNADPRLLYSLALARYRSGSPATAIKPLLVAIDRNDSGSEAHYLLGLVYRDTNNIEGAISTLETALTIERTMIAAREELADLYRVRSRYADEMAQLQALALLDPQPDRQVDIALAQSRAGQYDAALSTLAAITAKPADASRLQLARGRIYLSRAERTGDRASATRALDLLERALDGNARRSEGLALFGRARYLAGDYIDSERILREAIATSPVDAESFAFFADTAERLSHYADARDALIDLDALQGDTVSAEVRNARARRIGVLALHAGDPHRAADFLTQAIDGGHDDVGTLGLAAEAHWEAGDVAGAKRLLDQALTREPHNLDLKRLSLMIR